MIEKHAIFFLIIAITLSSACRPMKADPVAQSTKPEQPLVTGSDKLTHGSNPTVAEEATSPSFIDVEDPSEPQLSETPPITPETKLYYNYPTKADYDAGVFPSYVDPKCVEYLQETNNPIKVIDPCYFNGNTIVLAKFIRPLTGKNGPEIVESCINGVYQSYGKHSMTEVEILYVFKGEVNKKKINIKIWGVGNGILGDENEIALLNLYRDKKGNYITLYPGVFLNLKQHSLRIHEEDISELKYSCSLLKLPKQISELEYLLTNTKCDVQLQKEHLREELDYTRNYYGTPGQKCSENTLTETETEKEINNISGKKVPCSTCPEGYLIEDLSVDEYMDKVDEIIERRGK